MVRKAIRIAADAKAKGKPFESIWCVFDADPKADNPEQLSNFNKAVKLCEQSGFGTAYSNQAFEYWFLLHFEDHQGGAMPRTDYHPKLNAHLEPFRLSYDGNESKIVSQEMFDVLFEVVGEDRKKDPITRTDLAITRAKRIYLNAGNHRNPGKEESSTTVFRLVEKLIQLL